MPRHLYHLEGQQLRGLQEKALTIQSYLYDVGDVPVTVHRLVGEIETTIASILADGPQSYDDAD